MLQMLLKEMSYFSYKPLVFFLSLLIRPAVPPSNVLLLCFNLSFDGNER